MGIELDGEMIISCYPNQLAQVQLYESEHYQITILRLRCQPLNKQAIHRNKKRFKRLQTAFWKEEAQWHGIAKD